MILNKLVYFIILGWSFQVNIVQEYVATMFETEQNNTVMVFF